MQDLINTLFIKLIVGFYTNINLRAFTTGVNCQNTVSNNSYWFIIVYSKKSMAEFK